MKSTTMAPLLASSVAGCGAVDPPRSELATAPLTTLSVPPPAPPPPVLLHYKWAVVLCKYADIDSIPMQDGQPTLPADKAFFENLISEKGKGTGNLDDQVGHNKRPGNSATTCIDEAQGLIDFTKYDGIIPVVNYNPAGSNGDMGSTGDGPQGMTLNGVTRGWGIVVDGPTSFSATFLAHEMGHSAFAFDHSTDAAGHDYGDDPKGIDAGILNYTGRGYYEADPIVIEKVTNVAALMTSGASGPFGGFHPGNTFYDGVAHIAIKVVSVDATNNRATISISPYAGFSLAVNPSTTSLPARDTESLPLTTTIDGCSPVQLSVKTSAPGTTASLQSTTVSATGTSWLYLGVNQTTPPETGVVTVTGSCGGYTQTATVQLTTTACLPYQCGTDDCGTIDNGCGGTINCGGCANSLQCISNTCSRGTPTCTTPQQCCIAI